MDTAVISAKYQTKQTAPGFKRPYKRVENANSFQKLDIVEMRRRTGEKIVGCINSFDKTAEANRKNSASRQTGRVATVV